MSKTGHIHQINLSGGGVPKLPQPAADVTTLGLAGDVQRNKKHHGGPDRALCLYSLERIAALQAEGHPIAPGSTGENLTLSGIDWALMTPGTILTVGDAVRIELTSYAVPCKQIRASFAGEKFKRLGQKANPGWARVYARVLATGPIAVGDQVTVCS